MNDQDPPRDSVDAYFDSAPASSYVADTSEGVSVDFATDPFRVSELRLRVRAQASGALATKVRALRELVFEDLVQRAFDLASQTPDVCILIGAHVVDRNGLTDDEAQRTKVRHRQEP